MYVQDPELKLRLQTCVNSISDPFSTEIWYHDSCRKECLRPIFSTDETSERNLQNVTEKDVEQNLINYVNETIVNDEEPRTLKNLCKDYSNMLENFGLYKTVKSDHIKDLLILHFGDAIGFRTRHERNKSAIVYSRRTGQTYYEAVLNGSEVTNEYILSIACNRLRINIKKDTRYYMPWPPNLNDLCNKNKSESVMIKFLRNLRKTKLGSKNDAEIYFLGECIHTY